MRRFELTDQKSNKFWEITLQGSELLLCWGRIGTAGQRQTKSFANDEAARKQHDKLIAQKVGKGYLEVGGAGAPQPPAAAAASAQKAGKKQRAAAPSAPAASPPKMTTKAAKARAEQPPGGEAAGAEAKAPVAAAELPPSDVLVWTDGARRSAAAVRGRFGAPPSRGNAKALFGKLQQHFRKHQRAFKAGEKKASAGLAKRMAAVAAHFAKNAPPAELDVDTQAALFALLGKPLDYRDKPAHSTIVSYWLAAQGLLFALEAWAAGSSLQRLADSDWSAPKQAWLKRGAPSDDSWYFGEDASWRILRRWIAAADDELFGQVEELVTRLRQGAEIEVRCKLTAAFGENAGWAAEDAAAYLAKYQDKHSTGRLLMPLLSCFDDAGAVAELIGRPNLSHCLHEGAYSYDLVARLGVAAVEPLGVALANQLLESEQLSKEELTSGTKALALIHSRAAAELFLRLLERDDGRPYAAEYFQAAPRVAIGVLARSGSKAARKALKPIVLAARPWLDQLRPELDDEAWAPVEEALGDLAGLEEATADELPQVLAEPPWERASLKKDDPLAALPKKLPALPSFFNAAALARPRLREGSKALPEHAVITLAQMLAFSEPDSPYAGLAEVKQACRPESLAAFAWDLFDAWQAAGCPTKEAWALRALGIFGDDEAARRLTPLVRKWPGESAHHRAVIGLDVLAGIGSDVALMHLYGIAQKLKFKALQQRARDKIDEVAKARGLSAAELADRLVPDLGLDEQGSLTLDFGARSFTVGFDEALKPFVKDEQGKIQKDLPKPRQTDDQDKAQAATARYKALKQDARAISSGQVLRLELAMCAGRRWTPAQFDQLLIRHPLMIHLVRRLVWGVYEDGRKLRQTFRVAEDQSFAGPEDDTLELPDGAIGCCHALELSADLARRWGDVLADYEILQPFSQLGRDTYAPTGAERKAPSLDRVKGEKVSTGKVLGLERRGWRRGPPEDAGVVHFIAKPLSDGRFAHLDLEPGLWTGYMEGAPEQTLGSVRIGSDPEACCYGGGREKQPLIGSLTPLDFSELVRDLEGLRS